jgi:hypothetical protein
MKQGGGQEKNYWKNVPQEEENSWSLTQRKQSHLNLDNCADFEWQVGVLVLLADLQTRQVRKPQLHLVLVQEVLGDCALHGLAVLQLKMTKNPR